MSSQFVQPSTPSPFGPTGENIRRGTLAALLTIPAGVALWLVIWGFGFIASLVGAVIAVAAVRLYIWGAGRLSRAGAAVALVITVVTLLLAFFSGLVYDAAKGIGEITDLGTWGAFTDSQFWPTFWDVLPDALPDYYGNFAMAIVFGALGAFSTLRGAFAATAPAPMALPGQPQPMGQQYPGAQQYPMGQQYPAAQQYPMGQQYPAGQQYPTAGAAPMAPQAPMTPPAGQTWTPPEQPYQP